MKITIDITETEEGHVAISITRPAQEVTAKEEGYANAIRETLQLAIPQITRILGGQEVIDLMSNPRNQ